MSSSIIHYNYHDYKRNFPLASANNLILPPDLVYTPELV